MEAQILFPTVIWRDQLHEFMPMMDEWRQRLEDIRSKEIPVSGRSTRSGWSGPKTLFDDPFFQPLREKCQILFGQALREMQVSEGFRFSMEAWGNIHEPGGFNFAHIHRQAILSGCFYLHTPEGSGSIVFHDPRPGTLYSRPWGRGVNAFKKISISVKTGDFLLFPHWLEHSVEPNEAQECRYSIAMNAILPGMPRIAPSKLK